MSVLVLIVLLSAVCDYWDYTTAKTAHLKDGELYMQLQPIN